MSLTPAMKQYVYFKDKYPDCLLLFRMGDFYETFYEDAKKASEVLEITLTSRGKGDSRAPLAGIPYHALEPYLSKLVKNNIKMAIYFLSHFVTYQQENFSLFHVMKKN